MVKAIYARQSVDREDSISVESQMEFCRYELRGGTCKEYIDKGYSGKNTNRPAFKELLQDIRQGLIETVIVYKLDRISRSILDFSTMMETFQQYGVEFISSTEKFDTSSPIGRAMLNICVVFAQLERETIQKRVADAYYSRSKKGFYMGGRVPYGFRKIAAEINGVKTSCYEPIPEEAEQIRLMYSIYSQPEASLTDIIHHFNNNNIVHLRGKSWGTSRLSELLRNPIYVQADMDIYNFYKSQGANIVNDLADFAGLNACYLYKGETSDNKQYNLRNKHLVLAPHQGIVTSEMWLSCRIKCLNNRQSALPKKPKNSWLAGKIKCKECGYALTVRRNQQDRRYFVCTSNASYSTQKCSGPGTVHAEQLEEIIFKQIKKKLSDIKSLFPPESSAQNPKVTENNIRLAQIDNDVKTLVDKVMTADGALMKHINERITELEIERERLLSENLSLTRSPISGSLPIIDNHVEQWETVGFDERKLIADTLIKKVFVNGGNVDILWNT